jgi:predicted nucleic acid-binding protein
MKTVLDASILIAYLEKTDVHNQHATDAILEAADTQFLMAPLTYAEVLTGFVKTGDVNRAIQIIEGTLGVQVVASPGTPQHQATQLASLRANTNLKMPDVVVLQTAIDNDAAVLTLDKKLAKTSEARKLP